MIENYRPCAAAVVFNKYGQVFLGKRIDVKDCAWQFPQGGIEPGESPQDAAKRELFEETSILSATAVYSDKKPIRYTFPEAIKKNFISKGIFTSGQDIYFNLFFFTGSEEEINVKTSEPEFCSWMWGDFDFAVEHIIDFKKSAYQKAFNSLMPIIKQYLGNIS